MPHIVIFRAPDGSPAYHQIEELQGAVSFVEHLRNVEHVLDARIFALREVSIEFKTYYRVEVAQPVPEAAKKASAPGPSPMSELAPLAATVASVAGAGPIASGGAGIDAPAAGTTEIVPPTPVSANTRFGLFGRG